MSVTSSSASSSRPWMNSHRGDSGTYRRTSRIPTPRIAPRPKATRQPTSAAKIDGRARDDRPQCARGGAEPERAGDDQVHRPAHARGNQHVERGVDRRVLTADAGAGEEAAEREGPKIPRERRCGRRDQINRERDEEEFLAAPAIRQPAEEQRAQHRAGEIRRARDADIEVGKLQHRARLERPRHRAGERDFETVEDPRDAERDDDERVKPSPRQPIEPRRNVGFDDAGRCGCHAFLPKYANAATE